VRTQNFSSNEVRSTEYERRKKEEEKEEKKKKKRRWVS